MIQKMNSALSLGLGAFAIALSFGCNPSATGPSGGGGINDSITNVPEAAQAMVAGLANYSEQSSTGVATLAAPPTQGPAVSCATSRSRAVCSSNVMTINWNGCKSSFGTTSSAILTGQWTDTYASADACSAAQSGPLPEGQSFSRQSDTGVTMKYPNGLTITTDSKTHTTYSGVLITNGGTSVTMSAGQKIIQIKGLHRRSNAGGGADYSVITTTPISVSGTKAKGDRTIIGGTMTIYHNLSKYMATNTFNAVKWEKPTCCFPTSGSITTVYSGKTKGSTMLTFTPACGQATLSVTGSAFQRPIGLTQCE